MNIILLGYGKMGKAIEQIALQRNHQIVARIDKDNPQDLEQCAGKEAVAIEFSQPEAAAENIKQCLRLKIPVVSGTTGWLEQKTAIEKYCEAQQGAFFYASNYSIGVNLFFQLNQYLAQLMQPYPNYAVDIIEVHHTEKKDAPSGTAITLAEGIESIDPTKNDIPIESVRTGTVPGTHTIRYNSIIDTLEITHIAHNREGFALGAVIAAEWLKDKKGCFGMKDMLKF
ncbi:MAG: 4-hydroxy-tetrahydrodipicolinate reductase [Cytophagales bacterium]|nr:MAG: 4-hydroxy-tetrahydrodipicolinate reductase [Cytophagales bacterium]